MYNCHIESCQITDQHDHCPNCNKVTDTHDFCSQECRREYWTPVNKLNEPLEVITVDRAPDPAWEQTKRRIVGLREPSEKELANAPRRAAGYHNTKTKDHQIYEFYWTTKINGFDVEFIWGICSVCKNVRYKYWVALNNKKNLAFRHDLVRFGEPVEATAEDAEIIFNQSNS